MSRSVRKSEEKMKEISAIPTQSTSYNDLFTKIENLVGIEKLAFTKTLSLEEKKSYIRYLKEKDCEMVTGVFRCFEPLGGTLEMTAMAHEGEVPKKYNFHDGQQQSVPKYIAKRFESDFQGIGTWYPTHSHILDQYGKPMVGVGKKNRRFGFSSMEFQ